MPKYSIITIATNGLEHTMACVKSIFINTKDYELIIVNNNSNDGTKAWLHEFCAGMENVTILNTERKYNFSEANNLGYQIATGEYIIFLNNDTIVTEDWAERMHAHFVNVPMKNIGMVGPVSSMSNGKQMVGIQDSEQWHAQHRTRWIHTGVLYGWCMMIPKHVLIDIIEDGMVFDERFQNSHEDNDLCLRIQNAGYKLIIAYDTYIYHKGQGTLSQTMSVSEYMDSGYKNRKLYYDKYYEKKHKKLVAVYRTNYGKWLEESLAQTSRFADSIIIHFCRAPKEFDTVVGPINREIKVADLLRKFPKIKKVEFYDGIFQEDYERGWLLEEALIMHAKGEADWCISIDDDELYEDKFINRVQDLMNPRNPEIMGYWCQWRTIWDTRLGKEYFRTDSTFGRFSNYRFFKLMPLQQISSHHPEGHHCGSAPLIPEENLRWTNIRVKHMGYDTPEQRQRKFEFYQANDHFKTKADIGYDDYSHLISKDVNLEEYDADNGISLVMMIKNEKELILDCLEHVQYIIDEYIIVDTGSTDGTVEIVEEFAKYSPVPVKIFHYPWEDNYSTPRNFGKLHATQKWILHLDADERFKYNELMELFRITETDLDVYIFHVLNYMTKEKVGNKPNYASTESIRLFRNIPELFYSGIIHETLDDSMMALRSKRKIPMGRFNGNLHHYGYLKPKKVVEGKLGYYEKLNLRQLEITNGTDPRPYFNLALHYLQEEKTAEAIQAFQKSLEINPNFWMAHQQLAALCMRSAKSHLIDMSRSIPGQHPFRNEAAQVINFIDTKTFGHQKVA